MQSGYNEQTYLEPFTGSEAYGQDGHTWYTYVRDVADEPDLFRGFTRTQSINPLFTHLGCCTAAKLRGRGFIKYKMNKEKPCPLRN